MIETEPLWRRALRERAKRKAGAAARAMERSLAVKPQADAILRLVAIRFGVPLGALVGKERHRTTVQARHVAYWLLRQRGLSFPEIGRAVGNRDHTTVMAGVRKVEAMRDESEVLRAQLDTILAPVAKVRVRVDPEEVATA